jgi:hypothetical protein
MKKILFALSMLAFVALPQARGAEVSIDFFYNNISGGNWIEVSDYGYGWQPDVAVNDPNWRPYADGYWAYTDDGWTWISYEDFGWATYHYGRWANLADYGWTWFPGSDLDWGPAWVSWRTGGDYVGWAPLPPRGPGVVYEGQPIGGQVDIEFDIGPQYYNFIDARFIGEPVLRDRIFPPAQNVTYINNTVNVTNITVKNNVVYNYGPDYNVLSARSSRPIQRLTIERQAGANLSAAAKSGALTKVQGNKLVVAAPNKITKAAPGVAPRTVKTKVAQPKINRGWAGVPNEAELKQKIKTENPKNIPPPTGGAGRAPGGPPPAVGASPTAAAGATAPGAPVSPSPRGKPGRVAPGATATPGGAPAEVSPSPFERGRGRPTPRAGATAPGATASPARAPTRVSPSPFERGRGRPTPRAGATAPGVASSPAEAPAGVSPAPFERGRQPGKPGGRPQPGVTTSPAEAPGGPASPAFRASPPAAEHGRPPRGKPAGASPSPGQPGGSANIPQQGRGRGPGIEQAGPPPPAAAGAPEGRRGGEQRGQPGLRQPGAPPTGAAPGEAQRGQSTYRQPGGPPRGESPGAVQPGQGKPERGKKKGEKESPSPGPQ